ncbi:MULTISPECIES: peroxiredoxin-like family protein [Cryobacterium]|uniref:peroxiredoxin-like family protein n=1 Tax=Cryobacterium TaxID=69578 RepID=UPI000CD3B94C|nr:MULTISPECIES: peroxiredoxin-like family protein [Cryobacterium]POH64523.1 peroxiredoxin [Cryobacterium zongtaii]TFC47431.1 AhpC/TSA family protein [Cryobacterium sp. TMN-39-2]
MSIANTSIKEQVTVFNAESTESPAGNVFAAENAKKAAAGIPAGVSIVGDAFPEGKLLTAHGEETSFAAAAAGGEPAVVIFYRGAWCPYCNIALRTYNDALTDPLKDLGVKLIALSPQAPDGSLTMQEKNDLSFPVLSDPANQIARQLGILNVLTAEETDAATAVGLDFESVNADGTAVLSMPATVLVAADGTIKWIDVHPDYTTRTEPSEILDAVHTHFGK